MISRSKTASMLSSAVILAYFACIAYAGTTCHGELCVGVPGMDETIFEVHATHGWWAALFVRLIFWWFCVYAVLLLSKNVRRICLVGFKEWALETELKKTNAEREKVEAERAQADDVNRKKMVARRRLRRAAGRLVS